MSFARFWELVSGKKSQGWSLRGGFPEPHRAPEINLAGKAGGAPVTPAGKAGGAPVILTVTKGRGRLLLAVGLLGLALLLFSDLRAGFPALAPTVGPAEPSSLSAGSKTSVLQATDNLGKYEAFLEHKLEEILGLIVGTGRVRVMVTVASGNKISVATNDNRVTRSTQENDGGGVTRSVTEATTSSQPVLVRGDSAGEKPLVVEEPRPEIVGVVVVADGAGDSAVRTRLMDAVTTALGLPPHKIRVLTGN